MNPFDDLPHGSSHVPSVLSVVRRRGWTVVIVTLLLVGAALGLSETQAKRYSATAALLFRDATLDQKLFGSSYLPPSRDPDREAATNVRLVELPVVAERVAQEGGGNRDDILSSVSAESEGNSDLVTIAATRSTPTGARDLANAFAESFIAYRRDADRSKMAEASRLVQTQIDQLAGDTSSTARSELTSLRARAEQLRIVTALQTGNVELAQPAVAPSAPSSPKTKRNVAMGATAGLVLGLLLVLLLERVDRRIKDETEAESTYGLPILATIAQSRALADAEQPETTREAEAFRLLRARLRYFNVDRDITTVLITSEAPGEGKSTVARALARTAAQAQPRRVLLLEADLRRPTLATTERAINQAPGLSDVLAGAVSFGEAVQVAEVGGSAPSGALHVLTAGFLPPNPSALLESQKMQDLLRDVRREYAFVVVDTPPMSVVSDAIPLITQVDGVILVSRLGRATRDGARTLRSQLEQMKAPVLGLVFNAVRTKEASQRYSYYASSGEFGAEEPDEAVSEGGRL